jgi:hypothetical protein
VGYRQGARACYLKFLLDGVFIRTGTFKIHRPNLKIGCSILIHMDIYFPSIFLFRARRIRSRSRIDLGVTSTGVVLTRGTHVGDFFLLTGINV